MQVLRYEKIYVSVYSDNCIIIEELNFQKLLNLIYILVLCLDFYILRYKTKSIHIHKLFLSLYLNNWSFLLIFTDLISIIYISLNTNFKIGEIFHLHFIIFWKNKIKLWWCYQAFKSEVSLNMQTIWPHVTK